MERTEMTARALRGGQGARSSAGPGTRSGTFASIHSTGRCHAAPVLRETGGHSELTPTVQHAVNPLPAVAGAEMSGGS
ncbi:hypothetical protein [Paralimibaculum aggregatum]|uniref:hypothetical protein n=1 Tax=Paralimibaculum aggregatum TaxID=3036245 RepID=UPI00255330B9|nr:hypothetical protein [Limibaculum sp. NKW23]